RLCAHYQTASTDWPGFGDWLRPRHDWRPAIYSNFLTHLIGAVLPPLHAVIAAGYAVTFALLHACAHPGAIKRLVLRFVTGRLDPVETRSEFLDLAQRSPVPMLMVYGAQTLLRSRAEMEALASVQCIHSVMLPWQALGA